MGERVPRAGQARQQRVQLVDQRAHFQRHTVGGDGRNIARAALGQLLAHAVQGAQRPRHDTPDDQHQQRRQQRDGQHGPQRQLASDLAAHGRVLRHLDHLGAGAQRVHAKVGAAGAHVGKADHRLRRQQLLAGRAVQHHAIGAPDLDDQIARATLFAVQRVVAQHAGGHAAGQRQGDALHLRVKDGFGLGQRRAPGDQRLQHGDHRHSGQQRTDQPATQRRACLLQVKLAFSARCTSAGSYRIHSIHRCLGWSASPPPAWPGAAGRSCCAAA